VCHTVTRKFVILKTVPHLYSGKWNYGAVRHNPRNRCLQGTVGNWFFFREFDLSEAARHNADRTQMMWPASQLQGAVFTSVSTSKCITVTHVGIIYLQLHLFDIDLKAIFVPDVYIPSKASLQLAERITSLPVFTRERSVTILIWHGVPNESTAKFVDGSTRRLQFSKYDWTWNSAEAAVVLR
jgi:hypothetical protein